MTRPVATGAIHPNHPHSEFPTIAAAIIHGYGRGMKLERAAGLAGVTTTTLKQWVQTGAAALRDAEDGTAPVSVDDEPYANLVLGILRAEAELEAEVVGYWRAGFGEDWRAAAAFAAKRFRREWGDQTRVEVTGADGGPIQVVMPSDQDLRAMIALMAHTDEDDGG